MNSNYVNLTIDGQSVKSQLGLSLLLAAREQGIDIPTLCHHDDLKPEGQCRLCVVEIGEPGRTRLVNLLHLSGEARTDRANRLGEGACKPGVWCWSCSWPRRRRPSLSRSWPQSMGSTRPASKRRTPRPAASSAPVRPHLPGSGGGERHFHGLPHPEENSGHAL